MSRSQIDALFFLRSSKKKFYCFFESYYWRFTDNGGMPLIGQAPDKGYPKPIRGNWSGWPDHFTNSIDAAFCLPSNEKIYIFKGNQYLRHTYGKGCDRNYPKPISGNWRGLPSQFTNSIDAAVYLPENEKIYFFKNNEYLRYTFGEGCDRNYPKPIRGNWKGWPQVASPGEPMYDDTFYFIVDFTTSIDAAISFESKKVLYFFKDGYVMEHEYGTGRVAGPYEFSL